MENYCMILPEENELQKKLVRVQSFIKKASIEKFSYPKEIMEKSMRQKTHPKCIFVPS